MEHKIIFAGFGGQGVISMGMLTAHAGMASQKEVTFYPAYGIAMRGGTANCSVIVSDTPIASPIIVAATILVVMNEQSLDFFAEKLAQGGLLLVNRSLVQKPFPRDDIRTVWVHANDIAESLGDGRMANMAMMGGLLRATKMLPVGAVLKSMKTVFPPKLHHVLEVNQKALWRGYDESTEPKMTVPAS